MEESLYVKWDYDQTMVSQVGNKAASLGQLKKIDIKTPQGFAITQKAFLDFLADNGIYSKIKAQLSDLPAELEAVKAKSQGLRELFVEAEIPNKMINEITDACRRLDLLSKKKILFAVRSSSIIEDLPQASFAGLYDTFLNVTVGNELIESVKRCWQSAFNLRVLTYCQRLDLQIKDLKDIAIAVIVQEMINPRFAGVMFTVHPGSGDASKILIEYSAGLGNLVVLGERTPETILIDKVTNRIDKKGQDLLDERYIYQLASMGKKIEEHFGCYQDMEWAIDNDSAEIIILQARPETVWNEKHQKPFHQSGQSVLSFIPEARVKV